MSSLLPLRIRILETTHTLWDEIGRKPAAKSTHKHTVVTTIPSAPVTYWTTIALHLEWKLAEVGLGPFSTVDVASVVLLLDWRMSLSSRGTILEVHWRCKVLALWEIVIFLRLTVELIKWLLLTLPWNEHWSSSGQWLSSLLPRLQSWNIASITYLSEGEVKILACRTYPVSHSFLKNSLVLAKIFFVLTRLIEHRLSRLGKSGAWLKKDLLMRTRDLCKGWCCFERRLLLLAVVGRVVRFCVFQ